MELPRIGGDDAILLALGVTPARLWATGDPLPPGACRVRLEADLPAVLEAGESRRLTCLLENLGGAFLVTAPPNPVHLSYRWLDPATGALVEGGEGERTRLPQPVLPRATAECHLTVTAPPAQGDYCLRVTLVQEAVAWFDQLDPANACERLVSVIDARVAGATSLPAHAAAGPALPAAALPPPSSAEHDGSLSELAWAVTIRDQTIRELYQSITARDQAIRELCQGITARDRTIQELSQAIGQFPPRRESARRWIVNLPRLRRLWRRSGTGW